jgi:hypothetical protein
LELAESRRSKCGINGPVNRIAFHLLGRERVEQRQLPHRVGRLQTVGGAIPMMYGLARARIGASRTCLVAVPRCERDRVLLRWRSPLPFGGLIELRPDVCRPPAIGFLRTSGNPGEMTVYHRSISPTAAPPFFLNSFFSVRAASLPCSFAISGLLIHDSLQEVNAERTFARLRIGGLFQSGLPHTAACLLPEALGAGGEWPMAADLLPTRVIRRRIMPAC